MKKLIIGSLSFIFYVLNTVFWGTLILIFAFLKLIPIPFLRAKISQWLDFFATNWVSNNSVIQNSMTKVQVDVKGTEGLTHQQWYMIVANHQSWVDILVLQRILNGKTPFIKFFLKKELIWVPLLGMIWWALDFPFMQRYSKKLLRKKPHLKGKDIEETKKACKKFSRYPVSIMNFLEGTRFTPVKHQRGNAKFMHLLPPKAGGLALALATLGERMNKLLDVTIYYPDGSPTFWEFINGSVRNIIIQVNVRPIDPSMIGNYVTDSEFRIRFHHWVNELWVEKDQQLQQMSTLKG